MYFVQKLKGYSGILKTVCNKHKVNEEVEAVEVNAILKVTDKICNLSCKYCFYSKQRENGNVMSEETMEKVVREVCNNNIGSSQFIWHGGEPLMVGIEFYEKIIAYQDYYSSDSQTITNIVQTNGILIDERWSDFFRKHKFIVGVSLDGPWKVNNRYRVFSGGEGSFHLVMRGIKCLKKKGVDFSINTVVTKETTEALPELFSFLVSLCPTWISFIPSLSISTPDEKLSSEWSILPSVYVDFLIGVFDLWLKHENYKIKILPIETILTGFLGGIPRDTRLNTECKKNLCFKKCESNLVFTPEGDITTCAFHSYGDMFKFGNIDNGLEQVLCSKEYKRYKQLLKKLRKECRNCDWYFVCHDGCPRDFYLGDHNRGIMCNEFSRLFLYIEKALNDYPIKREWL